MRLGLKFQAFQASRPRPRLEVGLAVTSRVAMRNRSLWVWMWWRRGRTEEEDKCARRVGRENDRTVEQTRESGADERGLTGMKGLDQ